MIKAVRPRSQAPPALSLLLLLLAAACLLPLSCKSSEDPNTTSTTDTEVASIVITNDYGETLDISMDGTYQFTLEHEESEDVDNVSLTEHELKARLAGTDQVVDEEKIDVTSETAYSWLIDDPPDINIVNSTGVSLMIYVNEEYRFDLADEENRWIINLPFGEYVLKAYKVSNEEQYASTTVNVNENRDYTWTVY